METQSCPHCKQEIPANGLKCHYCREWVSRKYALKRASAWIVPFMVFWVGFMVFTDRMMFRQEDYWKHPDAIKITSHHAGRNDEGGLCIVGTMRNVSTIPWDSIAVQVDYLDSSDKLVDTSTDWCSDTLAPGAERSFKVVFEAKQRGADYDHYRVFVAGAEDASRF